MKRRNFSLSPWLYLINIFVLLIIGVIFVFEASGPQSYNIFNNSLRLFSNHLIGIGLAVIFWLLGLIIPIKFYFKTHLILYGFAILLMLATLFPGLGVTVNGASRWLQVGPMVIQPVEFLKFVLILSSSAWMTQSRFKDNFIILVSSLILPIILLLLQPDLGSLLVLVALVISLYYLSGHALKHLLIIGALAVPILIILIIIAPYRLQRVLTFFNPESDPLGSSFHVRQLTLALGRGGMFGQGLGNSSQKFSYVPEATTDSIGAIIGEETGLIGLLILILIYFMIFFSGKKIISQASAPTQLLGTGLLLWLIFQAFLNLAAVTALVPLTGIPLPLVSYGRSSLLMNVFALAIVFRIYLENRKKPG